MSTPILGRQCRDAERESAVRLRWRCEQTRYAERISDLMAPNYVYSVPVKPLPRALAGMTGGRHHGDEGTGDNGRATGMNSSSEAAPAQVSTAIARGSNVTQRSLGTGL